MLEFLSVKVVQAVLTITVAVVGTVLTVYRLKMLTNKRKQEQYQHYQTLRELCGSDAKRNLAQIYAFLPVLTERKLTPTEIEWFCHQPGAFEYLPYYGRMSRYLCLSGVKESNKEEARFQIDFKPKFMSKKRRFIEKTIVKLATILLLGLAIGVGVGVAMIPIELPFFVWYGLLVVSAFFSIIGVVIAAHDWDLIFLEQKVEDAKSLFSQVADFDNS